jgi:hypothetical protein
MKKGLDLSAFVRLLSLEAERFKEIWEKGHQRNKTAFPSTNDEGDWWKEFLHYLDSKGKR